MVATGNASALHGQGRTWFRRCKTRSGRVGLDQPSVIALFVAGGERIGSCIRLCQVARHKHAPSSDPHPIRTLFVFGDIGLLVFGDRALSRLSSISCRKSAGQNGGEDAFTLVELLVVLAIIGLVAGVVGPQVLRYLGSAKVTTTQTQMANIASALDLYYLDVGAYPPQEEGLAALATPPAGLVGWNGPYLKTGGALKDSWGNDFKYVATPDNRASIVSYGRDGKVNGEGLDADLVRQIQ